MPALGFHGRRERDERLRRREPNESVQVDLGGDAALHGARCYRYKGASEGFTQQLLSPALIDWLARSEADLGFELADGVLCTSRKGYLEDATALEALCADAAHLTRGDPRRVRRGGGHCGAASRGGRKGPGTPRPAGRGGPARGRGRPPPRRHRRRHRDVPRPRLPLAGNDLALVPLRGGDRGDPNIPGGGRPCRCPAPSPGRRRARGHRGGAGRDHLLLRLPQRGPPDGRGVGRRGLLPRLRQGRTN